MTYRRMLIVAVGGTVALAGAFLGFFKGDSSGKRYRGSRLYDNGLSNYTFVDSKQFELLNATVLFRHGARTPVYFMDSKFNMPDWESGYGYVDMLPELDYDVYIKEFPSLKIIDEDTVIDEYIELIRGRCQWGQITLIGQEQSISFGKELRRIYMCGYKLLQSNFNEDEIYCRSTKFPRTFFSLKGILSGIYGIKSFDTCHRPTIHTMKIEMDPFYPNLNICPVLGKFVVAGAREISQDHEVLKMKCLLKNVLGVNDLSFFSSKKNRNETEVCENRNTASKITPIKNKVEENVPIYAVRDDFVSRQVHEFPVPSNFATILPEINRLSSEEILFEYLGGSVEWEDRIILLVSPILNFMKKNFREVLERSENPMKVSATDMRQALTRGKASMKMQLVSCHDTTLIPLLVCLKIYDGQWPVFMSNIIIELYNEKLSQNIYIRLLYNGNVHVINMSEGDSCELDDAYSKTGLMPYKDFIKFLDRFSFPDDKYSSVCNKALSLFSSGKPVTKDNYL